MFCIFCALLDSMAAHAQIQTNAGIQYLQAMQKDMSTDFFDLSNTYFLADSLVSFDAQKGEGLVQWKRYRLTPRQAFNLNGYWPVRMQMLDFPDAAYVNDKVLVPCGRVRRPPMGSSILPTMVPSRYRLTPGALL